tara:strand:- start:101 stop:310 length:210 start_codon:yes stop_codon:yes gene_type:complete
MTPTQIRRIADTVEVWHTPQRNQGQMVEISYGRSDDGDIVERTIDRSIPETTYRVVGGASDAMPTEYGS